MTTPPALDATDLGLPPEQAARLGAAADRFGNLASDAYINLISGQGVAAYDQRVHDQVAPFKSMTAQQISAICRGDFIARNVCELPARDALRRGWDITIKKGADGSTEDDGSTARAIQEELEEIRISSALRTALTWDRQFGGSALLVAADEGLREPRMEQPLTRYKRIVRLLPLERAALIPAPGAGVETDPASPRYGLAKGWMVRMAGEYMGGTKMVLVDASRLIIWTGVPLTIEQRTTQGTTDTWGGGTVLDAVQEPLRRYRTLWGFMEGAFRRFSVIVFQMAGLAQMMQANGTGTNVNNATARLQLMNLAMSNLRMIPIDAQTEKVEELTASLTGAAEVLRQAQDDVCGAAGMPATKLFGHSPAGFSTDDEPGWENYNAKVQDVQADKVRDPLNQIMQLVCGGSEGPTSGRIPKRWMVNFRPLDVETADALSQRRNRDADTATKLILAQVVSPDEVRQGMRADPTTPYPLTDDAAPGFDDLEPGAPEPPPGDEPEPDPAEDPEDPEEDPAKDPEET